MDKSTPFELGYRAFNQLLDFPKNPFDYNTKEYDEWNEGMDHAAEDFARKEKP